MATNFTDEQLKAIETLDRSVLVSAAAGSGKTAVLVERIIKIILEGRANVDELLVVTFTNAAASEMRLRLGSAIRKRMADHPEEAPRMKDQLARLYKAYISTIDSFALRVIREFFHGTDMEPSFGIADEVQCELMKREALNEMFEECFENDGLIEGGSFRAFLRLYSEERTDEGFMDGMLRAYDGLRSLPDYFEWAYGKAEQLRVGPDTFEGSDLRRMMLADAQETFGNVMSAFGAIRELFAGAGIEKVFDEKFAPQTDTAGYVSARTGAGEFDEDVIASINTFPSVTIRAARDWKEPYESIKSEVKKLRDALKKEIDGFRNRYLVPDFESRLAELNATYEYTVYYLRMLEEFERRYEEKKREKRVIDFGDMEHIAARVLKNDDAADILRRRFKYIFVDEYQDTNHIQEHLISRIARPDNVFRVGDVRQSIYKFRQAEPEIFERLYAEYSSGRGQGGAAIDLSRNFRSNDATIRYINRVFSRIMDGYDERAMLYTGLDCPAEYDFIPEVHVLLEDSGNTAEADETAAITEEDDELEEITKEEAEAEYIADLAASIIGTEFYDTKTGTVRKAGARDIVILFRAVSVRGEIMSRALREHAIEPHIEETEDYFDTVEIGVALSLLTCIDNIKRDIPLISVLHSEIFGFDAGELSRIRIAHGRRSAYYEAFDHYADEGPDEALKEKTRAAREQLLEWRGLSRIMPLEDFVWKVLVDSGYYRMAGAMPGGAARQANLRALADRAAGFSRGKVATLSSFITFLDLLRSKKISNGQASAAGRDDDVVRISTIHKSKGLEYPFVIIGGLGHRFRFDSNEKSFSFDSDAGVGLPYVDPSRKYWRSTIVQRAINSKSRRDSYREELRLLYVAMTRARNKLYMVGTCKKEEDLTAYRARPGSFFEAMGETVRTGFNRYITAPLMLSRSNAGKGTRSVAAAWLDEPLSGTEQSIYEEIDRRFSYRYPYEDMLSAKAKYSVSELRRAAAEEDSPDGESTGMETSGTEEIAELYRAEKKKKSVSAADTGTAYHRIMEFMDFTKAAGSGRADMEYIAERAAFLKDHGAIDEDVYASVDIGKIAAFFESDIGRRAVRADARGALKREKPFTLKTSRDGREMLVQGVIDCCFEEDGGIVLIDYKSSYIRPGRQHEAALGQIRRDYAVQIELYKEAVTKGTGMEVKEAYLYLFATGEAVDMIRY